MKHVLGFALLLPVLAGCAHPESPDSVDSLITHPVRLQALTAACRDHRPEWDTATCAAAAEAERRRFMRSGSAHYTPEAIGATPSERERK